MRIGVHNQHTGAGLNTLHSVTISMSCSSMKSMQSTSYGMIAGMQSTRDHKTALEIKLKWTESKVTQLGSHAN